MILNVATYSLNNDAKPISYSFDVFLRHYEFEAPHVANDLKQNKSHDMRTSSGCRSSSYGSMAIFSADLG